MNDVGVYFFKFRKEEGMNSVVESGQPKWRPELCLDKAEPDKISLWVAWSVKGISAIASRFGKPCIMYAV